MDLARALGEPPGPARGFPSYCHVGEEEQPLSTYDFASDDNPKKDIARTMYNMLGAINDTLASIDPSAPSG